MRGWQEGGLGVMSVGQKKRPQNSGAFYKRWDVI